MRHLRYCKGTTPFTATVVDEPRPTELVEAVVVGNISTAPNHSIVGATYALHEANTEVMSSVAETEVIFNDKEMAIAEAVLHLSYQKADNLLRHFGGAANECRFATKAELETILLGLNDNWNTQPIDIHDPSDGQELHLWMVKDPVKELQMLVEAEGVRIVLEPHVEHDNDGNRVYSSVHTGKLWNDLHNEVIKKEGTTARVVPFFLWSDKSHITLGKVSFWAVVLVCAAHDIGVARLRHFYKLIALLPIVKKTISLMKTKGNLTLRRLEVFHKSLGILFQPLKDAGRTGVEWNPWHGQGTDVWNGRSTLCFPLLFAYLADLEEAWDLACIRRNGKYPIINRLVHESMLDNYQSDTSSFPLRSSADMKRRVALAQAVLATKERGCKEAGKAVLDPVSGKPVHSALFGFRGADPLQCIVTVDPMHQDKLGVTMHILTALTESCSKPVVGEISSRLATLSKVAGVKLPSNVSEVDGPHMRAEEKGKLMTYLPYTLLGLVPHNIINAVVAFNRWRDCRDLPVHTDTSLLELETKCATAQEALKIAFPQKSWKFPKFWNMRESVGAIRKLGPVWRMDVGYFEKTFVYFKEPIKLTNKRPSKVAGQLLKQSRNFNALDIMKQRRAKVSKKKRRGGGGLIQRAGKEDGAVTTITKRRIRYEALSNPRNDPTIKAILDSQPELLHFENSLRLMLAGYPKDARLNTSQTAFHPHPQGKCIHMRTALILSAFTEPIRAISGWRHGGGDRYDSVKVKNDIEPDNWYMQVRMIFTYKNAQGEEIKCVFGRWYKTMGFSAIMEREQLQWASFRQRRGRVASYHFDCIHASDIERRVSVVPDFQHPNPSPLQGFAPFNRFYLAEPQQ